MAITIVPMDAASREHGDPARRPLAALAYDRSRLRPGIVHLGLGGFARAHLAAYVHDLMLIDPAAARWGIVGVGLREADRPLLAALAAEDHLYTLVERDGDGERQTVIGSLVSTLDASAGAGDLLRVAAAPGVAVLSLTVTERGYCLGADRRLDLAHPAIARDLDDASDPRSPIGLVAAILARRREDGTGGMTVMSCDNIQHNGDVLGAAVRSYAATAFGDDLAAWIDANAAFPNAMVDRITPRPDFARPTTLVCEPFRQWVVEDRAAGDRPALDRVGVQLVADVTPYERMKLWLLNASHLALAGPAEMLGIPTVAEAMKVPAIADYIKALMARETLPAVGTIPGIDLPAYADELIRRFANPAIPDTPARINADAPISYLLDPIRAIRADHGPTPLLTLAVCFWLRRMRSSDASKRQLETLLPQNDGPTDCAASGIQNVLSMLDISTTFDDLKRDAELIDDLSCWNERIASSGTLSALEAASARV